MTQPAPSRSAIERAICKDWIPSSSDAKVRGGQGPPNRSRYAAFAISRLPSLLVRAAASGYPRAERPREERLVRRGIEGPPDLLIEVLSPSNRAHDQVRKRELYARAGVREYWIVDPEQRVIEIIDGRGLTVHHIDSGSESVLRSPLLGELAVSLDEIVPVVDDLPA